MAVDKIPPPFDKLGIFDQKIISEMKSAAAQAHEKGIISENALQRISDGFISRRNLRDVDDALREAIAKLGKEHDSKDSVVTAATLDVWVRRRYCSQSGLRRLRENIKDFFNYRRFGP